MKRSILFSLFLAILFVACKSDGNTNAEAETENKTEENVQENKYTLTAFSDSQEFEGATLSEMSYKEGTFSFKVDGGGYELGAQTTDAESKMCANSGKGQHIHLIVDNEPYAAKYVNTFEHKVADGEHHLLAFLSRSYHESIKSDGASIAAKVNVENGSITSEEAISDPMIFYSRPKGTYVGKDAEKVMLDFFLVNTDLDNGNKVVADINGEIHEIDKWQPYYIEGMEMGENKIVLTLVDSEGNKLEIPNNPVERIFTLKEDPEKNM